MVELRRGLDIDPGYLSRILRRFEADGLVTRERSASGGRRQIITLIPAGRATSADLDARSAEQITGLLDGIDESDRRRLGGAMGTIEEILSRAQPPTSFVLRPLAPETSGGWSSATALATPRSTGGITSSKGLSRGSSPTT